METTKKVYLANLKSFGNFGSIKGRIYADKTAEHWQTDDKGRKYLPIIINLNKEPDQYGNTHAIVLDTWKPDTQQAPVSKSKTETAPNDLPF
jgi:hypothetical protein